MPFGEMLGSADVTDAQAISFAEMWVKSILGVTFPGSFCYSNFPNDERNSQNRAQLPFILEPHKRTPKSYYLSYSLAKRGSHTDSVITEYQTWWSQGSDQSQT